MRRYLTKTIDAFKRHGAELDPAGKARLKEIDVALAEIDHEILGKCSGFDQRLGPGDRPTNRSWRDCRPAAIAAARAVGRIERAREGWRFTLQAPSYMAVMTYLDDAAIREQMWRAYNTRAASGELRQSPADREDSRSAQGKSPPAGLPRLRRSGAGRSHGPHRRPRAGISSTICARRPNGAFAKRIASSRAFAGNRELQPWDVGYWAEKQRAALYDFDEEALRPYFPLERVVNGMFRYLRPHAGHSRRARNPAFPAWDPEVRCYAIHDAPPDALSGIVLRRLVSARKQARRRVDGRADHRQSGRKPSRISA